MVIMLNRPKMLILRILCVQKGDFSEKNAAAPIIYRVQARNAHAAARSRLFHV